MARLPLRLAAGVLWALAAPAGATRIVDPLGDAPPQADIAWVSGFFDDESVRFRIERSSPDVPEGHAPLLFLNLPWEELDEAERLAAVNPELQRELGEPWPGERLFLRPRWTLDLETALLRDAAAPGGYDCVHDWGASCVVGAVEVAGDGTGWDAVVPRSLLDGRGAVAFGAIGIAVRGIDVIENIFIGTIEPAEWVPDTVTPEDADRFAAPVASLIPEPGSAVLLLAGLLVLARGRLARR